MWNDTCKNGNELPPPFIRFKQLGYDISDIYLQFDVRIGVNNWYTPCDAILYKYGLKGLSSICTRK